MGLFDRLFGNQYEEEKDPGIRFGRYSDSYKTAKKFEVWDQALISYENGDYLNCYKNFFKYLRDEEEDNVFCRENGEKIQFEFFQGSKRISGFADRDRLRAEAKIAYSSSLNVGFMRRLIEKNFELKFSRFALDKDNNIVIVFGTYSLDGSPYKLYHALKELATNADKQDDLLLDEFKMLEAVETGHLESLPDSEKVAKYEYIIDAINQTLHTVNEGRLNKQNYPRGISMLLLDLIYRLDYLTKPEGYMMESLERMHRKYFAKDGRSLKQKNHLLEKQLVELANRPKEEFFKEMYLVKATFGITDPINHDRIVDFIDAEIEAMEWYQQNKYEEVARAIPGYIVGYCMFYFAVPKPDKDFFHLYYKITNNQYFKSLGYSTEFYDAEAGTLNKRSIRKAIDQIVAENKAQYPGLQPDVNSLSFDSLTNFVRTYLSMIRDLDMAKVE